MTATCFDRFTSLTERTVARTLIDAILEAGYSISVYDGEEFNSYDHTTQKDVTDNLATTGEDRLYIRKPDTSDDWCGWFWLIWGNGEDLISDYAANDVCEAIVQPIYETLGLY